MTIVQSISSFLVTVPSNWTGNWVWGLPLIVLTVVIHVLGLGLIRRRTVGVSSVSARHRHQTVAFLVVVGGATLLVTVLHGIEANIWAVAYRLLDALPDFKSAVLYSLNAMTSYGHTNLDLEPHWHLMRAMEALNGWLLFGLTTAFLFTVIEEVRSTRK